MGFYRTLLALTVFLFHTTAANSLNVLHGRVAVFCFFVISGFYIEMILSEKYTKERIGPTYVRSFYLARFWRLYPAYFLVTAITLLLTLSTTLLVIPESLQLSLHASPVALMRGILAYFANASMMLLNLPSVKDLVISPAWSVGVEISFYALAPFILHRPLRVVLPLAAIAALLQFVPYGQHAPVLFGFPFFIAGALCRRYRNAIIEKLGLLYRLPLPVLYGIVIVMFSFAIPHDIYLGSRDAHKLNTLDIFLYPALTALLIPILHERTKASRTDYLIGQVSFPFYLAHQPVIDLFASYQGDYRFVMTLSAATACAIALTWLELRFIEPWRKHFSNPPVSKAARLQRLTKEVSPQAD